MSILKGHAIDVVESGLPSRVRWQIVDVDETGSRLRLGYSDTSRQRAEGVAKFLRLTGLNEWERLLRQASGRRDPIGFIVDPTTTQGLHDGLRRILAVALPWHDNGGTRRTRVNAAGTTLAKIDGTFGGYFEHGWAWEARKLYGGGYSSRSGVADSEREEARAAAEHELVQFGTMVLLKGDDQ